MTVNSRTVYIDLDDVLCQAARRFLLIVEREFGKKITYEQLTDFDVGTACGLLPDECDELYRIVHKPDELMQMAPIAEAIATVKRWANDGYNIAIVTGRPPAALEPSQAWLEKHNVPHHSFTMVDKYARFETVDTPAISLQELAARSYCWAVEDSLPMAQYLAGQMRVPVALIDCPWNRSAQEHANVSRCRDWPTIARSMPRLADNKSNF
jgi:uncharacterized HAD superfamily protein